MRKEISREENWIIEFDTYNERFYLYQLNEGKKEEYGSYDTYDKTNEAIKRAETVKKRKISPLSFIKQEAWSNEYEKGKITSLAEEGMYGFYVWVSVDKSRSKQSGHLIKDIVENEEILQKIKELEESAKNEKKKLEYYTPEEIKTHFGEEVKNGN